MFPRHAKPTESLVGVLRGLSSEQGLDLDDLVHVSRVVVHGLLELLARKESPDVRLHLKNCT
jgi:hypothetical protein